MIDGQDAARGFHAVETEVDESHHSAEGIGPTQSDAVVIEHCDRYPSLGLLSSSIGDMAIFNATYQWPPVAYCAAHMALGINGARFNLDLTGVRRARA